MYDDTHYFDTTHDPINGLSEAGTNCSNLPVLFMGGGSSSNSNNINNSLEENLKISTTFSLEDHHNHHLHPHSDLAPHLEFELDQEFNAHLMQEVFHQDPNTTAPGFDQSSNWDNAAGIQEIHQHIMQEVLHDHHPHHHQQQQFPVLQDNFQCFSSSSSAPNFATNASSSTPDLLNLLHLPRCSPASLLPNSSISFTNQNRNKQPNFPSNSLDIFGEIPASVTPSGDTISASTILYDPPLHLNLPPQPPIFRELLHSLPHNYNLPGSRTAGGGGLFSGIDEIREGGGGGGGGVYQDGDVRQFENSVLDFRRERSGLGKGGGGGGEARGANHFATERQRREQLNAKYLALKQLVPNPTKSDRASIVGDAIEYIKELLRTVDELKILVEKKRCGRDHKRSSTKRLKTDQDDQAAEGGSGGGDMESSSMKPHGALSTDREQSFNGSLRSSWLQRKSKETEVDVRIIDDEVTIKLVQRKKMHCLLSVSRILDELQLDLLHVSGGNIGDYYSFLFNTKIYEGSSVYASAIAKKLIEAVDKQHAAFQPSSL